MMSLLTMITPTRRATMARWPPDLAVSPWPTVVLKSLLTRLTAMVTWPMSSTKPNAHLYRLQQTCLLSNLPQITKAFHLSYLFLHSPYSWPMKMKEKHDCLTLLLLLPLPLWSKRIEFPWAYRVYVYEYNLKWKEKKNIAFTSRLYFICQRHSGPQKAELWRQTWKRRTTYGRY